MANKTFYLCIMTNVGKSMLYIGVTNNLKRRVQEHKSGLIEGFTKKYRLTQLAYFEEYSNSKDAITREKQLKNWHRQWKINLIRSVNPDVNDLAKSLV